MPRMAQPWTATCSRANSAIAWRRWRWPWTAVAVLALLLAAPWSGRVSAPAMLKADSHVMLYPPMAATLAEIAVTEGQNVKRGDVLARLDNPDIRLRLETIMRLSEGIGTSMRMFQRMQRME